MRVTDWYIHECSHAQWKHCVAQTLGLIIKVIMIIKPNPSKCLKTNVLQVNYFTCTHWFQLVFSYFSISYHSICCQQYLTVYYFDHSDIWHHLNDLFNLLFGGDSKCNNIIQPPLAASNEGCVMCTEPKPCHMKPIGHDRCYIPYTVPYDIWGS